MENEVPRASVIICTRNRGATITQAVKSVLANQYDAFEVIVVDQSTNDETQRAIAEFLPDPRFRYLHSDTVGASKARNIGLFEARGVFVAFTDDDCVVPTGWLQAMDNVFRAHEKVAVIYCKVTAPADAPANGYTPIFVFDDVRMIATIEQCKQGLGMGAGMAVRRLPVSEMGGFDQMLGPGAKFQAGEDYEIGVRAIKHGWLIYESPDIEVVHYGFRTVEEYRKVARRDWFGLGGVFAKYLKCAYYPILHLIVQDWLIRGFLKPFAQLFKLKKPAGIRNFFFAGEGFLTGLASPIDRTRFLYSDG